MSSCPQIHGILVPNVPVHAQFVQRHPPTTRAASSLRVAGVTSATSTSESGSEKRRIAGDLPKRRLGRQEPQTD